jgi:hypothetical protein
MAGTEELDWNRVEVEVKIVEEWELRADGMATDLVITLYEELCCP